MAPAVIVASRAAAAAVAERHPKRPERGVLESEQFLPDMSGIVPPVTLTRKHQRVVSWGQERWYRSAFDRDMRRSRYISHQLRLVVSHPRR